MSFLAVIQLVALFAAATLLVHAAGWESSSFAAFAAATLGVGLCALSYLLWLLLAAPVVELQVLIDLLLLGVAALLWRRRRRTETGPPAGKLADGRGAALALAVLTVAVLAAGAVALLVALRFEPHGKWDAFAIWNLRARFLFHGAGHWNDAFHPELVHNDYPLLQPLIVARGWSLVGHASTAVPRVVAFLCAGLTLGLLTVTLKRLRGIVPACLGVLAVLAFPSAASPLPLLLEQASSQYADTTLACFLLASFCCLAGSLAGRAQPPLSLALAGAFAGLTAWTKNEGKLLALVLPVVLILVTARRRGRDAALGRISELLCGLLPLAVLLWIVNAAFVRSPEGFFVQPFPAMVDKVLDLGRHRQIVTIVFSFLTRSEHLPVLFLLALYAGAAGLTARRGEREAAAILAATLAAVVAGYYVIYLISPYALEWHLRFSIDRLFVQLWPSFVLLLFLAARSPDEVAHSVAPSPSGAPER